MLFILFYFPIGKDINSPIYFSLVSNFLAAPSDRKHQWKNIYLFRSTLLGRLIKAILQKPEAQAKFEKKLPWCCQVLWFSSIFNMQDFSSRVSVKKRKWESWILFLASLLTERKHESTWAAPILPPHLLPPPRQQHRGSQAERTLQRGKTRWVCISANWDRSAAVDMVMGMTTSLSAGHITENQVLFHVSSHFGE